VAVEMIALPERPRKRAMSWPIPRSTKLLKLLKLVPLAERLLAVYREPVVNEDAQVGS
jgi:hypothetical protein